MPTDLEPSEFALTGGAIGVMLIHGFPGSPVEMRLIGNYLHSGDLTVLGPLLPGHGTSPEDLNRRIFPEWVKHVERALYRLQDMCELVFVAGLSLGSLLTLKLAIGHELPGIVAIAPPFGINGWRRRLLPLFKHFVPEISRPKDYYADPQAESRLWCYDTLPTKAADQVLKLMDEVSKSLSQVSAPILIIYSTGDPLAHSEGSLFLYDSVGSTDKELIQLRESGHAITVDKEWEIAAECIYKFIIDHSETTA
jgi:carboxylesterase